jgi:hypothetical protein
MNTEQAYIEGFVKRASEYGLTAEKATSLLKAGSAMPDALKKSLLDILRKKKVQTDIKSRLILGGGVGGYAGLIAGDSAASEVDAKGKLVSKNPMLDRLKGILVGGGLGLAAGGISGLANKRNLINKYMQTKVQPRFEELVKNEPNAPLNRLANLIKAETTHDRTGLQTFMNNNKFKPFKPSRQDGDEWKDIE